MVVHSKYKIGDNITLLNGRVAKIRAVHIYIGASGRIGYQLYIGDETFIKEKDIKYLSINKEK